MAKKFKVRWENILSPDEMRKKFGPSYQPIEAKKDGEVYVSSDYFVEEATKLEYVNPQETHKEILRIFLSLSRDLTMLEYKKCYPDNYPFSEKNPLKIIA